VKLLGFVIFGFFVGVAAYYLLDGLHLSLDWLHLSFNFVQTASTIIVLAPWAISGVIGSLLYGSIYSAFSLWSI
jgi:hypothetical protein